MITLDDVLSIRHPDPPRYSPDGNWLGFTYTIDGCPELWAVPSGGGPPVRLSAAGERVTAWDWQAGATAVWATGGTVWQGSPEAEPTVLLDGRDAVAGVASAPDGRAVAVLRSGRLLLQATDTPRLREAEVPGAAAAPLAWSPDGTYVACGFLLVQPVFAA